MKVNGDDTFHVSWKDGSENLQLHRDMMRTLKAGVGRIVSTKLRLVCPSVSRRTTRTYGRWKVKLRLRTSKRHSIDILPVGRFKQRLFFTWCCCTQEEKEEKEDNDKKETNERNETQDSDNNDNDNNNTTTTTKPKKKRRSKRVKEKNNAKNIYTEFDGVSIHSSTKWRSKIRLLENAKHLQLGFS